MSHHMTTMDEMSGVDEVSVALYRLWVGGGLVRPRELRSEVLWTADEVLDWLLSETPVGGERAQISAQVAAGTGEGALGMIFDGLGAGMPRFTYRLERAGDLATQVARRCRARRLLVERVKSEAFREVARMVERSAAHDRVLCEVEEAGQRWDAVLARPA